MLGIAHAAVQTGLQRVIAYSSVENTGLILAGFGVALVGAAVRDQRLVAAGLLAATLQVIAHTAAKSLLFTASAGMESAAGTDDLDELRGVAQRAPWRGTGLAIGALTLAGLPPTAGFVSEWFLLEALMQQFRVPGLGYRLVLAVAGAAVALTAGFAGVTFVRMVGLVVLGQPRVARATASRPGCGTSGSAAGSRSPCSAPPAWPSPRVTPLEIRVIAAGLSPVVAAARDQRGAEVPVGAAAGVHRVLDPLAVLALDRHASLLVLVTLLAWAAVGPPPDPGPAGACVALGHGGRGRIRPATRRSASPTRPAGCSRPCCTPAPRSGGWPRRGASPGLRHGRPA